VNNNSKSYIDMLPAIFRAADKESQGFLELYLNIFQKILSESNGYSPETGNGGISGTIDILHEYFYPDTAPTKFLDWLSTWMGLVLREDWDTAVKKKIIRTIIPLYRLRGTRRGIEEILRAYTGSEVEVKEVLGSFLVGLAKVGHDTVIGGDMMPHFFIVNVWLPDVSPEKREQKTRNIRRIIDAEKPVHTNYMLNITIPTMRVGMSGSEERDGKTVYYGCTVEKDTLIGGTYIE